MNCKNNHTSEDDMSLKIATEDITEVEKERCEAKQSKKQFPGYIHSRNDIIDRANRRRIRYNKKVRGKKARSNWIKNRKKLLKGIKRFHRSTAGKRFHRALSSFNSRNGTKPATAESRIEMQAALSSFQTHLIIEERYIKPVCEQVSFSLFKDMMSEEISTMLGLLRNNNLEQFEQVFDDSMHFYYEWLTDNTIVEERE